MKLYEHSGILFISLNAAEHVAVTLPGSMLDDLAKSKKARDDQFVFFGNEEGTLLRVSREEYEILRPFLPKSPFDEELKRLLSAHYMGQNT